VKATFSLYPDKEALKDLDHEVRPVYSFNPLVQIAGGNEQPVLDETRVQAGPIY